MKNLVGPIRERIVDLEHFESGLALQPYSGHGSESYVEEGPQLRDHWRSVRNHPVLVIGLTLLITIAVGVFLGFRPDVYDAEAQVQVDLENINPQLRNAKSSSFIVNPVNDPAYFNTQLQLLTRPWLLRRVIKILDIEHNLAFVPAPSQGSSTWANFLAKLGLKRQANNLALDDDVTQGPGGQGGLSPEDLAEATRLEPYVELIQSTLTVEPVKESRLPTKDTRLINISFTHSDPKIATKLVNTLADNFVRSNLEKKNNLNTMNGDILQKRITELQTEIRNGEERLINYAKDHEILSLDPSQNTVVERLAGLNRQLLEAENDRKLAEAAYESARVPGAADALAEAAVRDSAEAENRLNDLRQRRAQLLVEATEEWPEVKELDQQIGVLEKFVTKTHERAAAVTVTNLGTKYRQALAREQALRAAFNLQRGDTLKQNEAAIYYRMMQQEVETSKNLLDGLFQQQKENDGMMAGMINNIRVNDYASIPQVPVGPRRLLYTGVAFAFSLALSLGLAVLTDYMDNTVVSSNDVEKTLHARTLASIPLMSDVIRSHLIQLSDSSVMSEAMRGRLLQLSDGLPRRKGAAPNQSELLLDHIGQSGLTEVYRHLRTSMLLSNGDSGLHTILVTASMPGEGKTTTAVNTALTLGRTGASVLIIDADTRNPRIHRIFDLDNERGLSTILNNGMEQSEVLSLIKQHEASGISVLTAGPADPNFTELLGSGQMRGLISELRSNFKYVIIDSPPVAHFADGILISQMVDGVLLVVNSGRIPREVVRQSHQLLEDAGANIVGVVLNNVKTATYDSYYQRYYSRQSRDASRKDIKGKQVGEPDAFTVSRPLRIDRRMLVDDNFASENPPSTKS
jgi:polysaccharide biosynthesis transport protein